MMKFETIYCTCIRLKINEFKTHGTHHVKVHEKGGHHGNADLNDKAKCAYKNKFECDYREKKSSVDKRK